MLGLGVPGKPQDSGRELEQEIEVTRAGGCWRVAFSSRSGKIRNRDYDPALRLVLTRLRAIGATLEVAVLASRPVLDRPRGDRALPIGHEYPLQLATCSPELLRAALCEAQAARQFRAPDAKGSGRARKRIELDIAVTEELSDEQFLALVFLGGLPEGRVANRP